MKVRVKRAGRGLKKRNQFQVALEFDNGKHFAGTETYDNHVYALQLAQEVAGPLGAEVIDETGIPARG